MQTSQLPSVGTVRPEGLSFDAPALLGAVRACRAPCFVVGDPATGRAGVARSVHFDAGGTHPLIAALPPLYPEWLGDRSFAEVHGVRFPYATGAMANGIATVRLVTEVSRAGFIGFFGAAGLSPKRVEAAIDELQANLQPDAPWGVNLIHSPNEPSIEAAITDLLLARGVRRVEASAFMGLTPNVVRYSYRGLREEGGRVVRPNHVFAKISRPEVARRFLEPAPKDLLDALVAQGKLTGEEARLAARLPVAEDLTVEADSGGHTDNQALPALFPTILSLRDEIARRREYARPIRVGAAGGLGTPSAVAAAFSLGAAYVLTGSVNQACVESGLHESGRKLLADAEVADVVMAPAADMFELGVDVQVLKRGTLFAPRAKRLYELYRAHERLEDLPAADRARLEKEMFMGSIAEAWAGTRDYWMARDPEEIARAEREPKHRMALLFRSYLGQSSRWAIAGEPKRKADYQIWCGPAMGAFNAWTRGSFLADPARREVVQVARNLMEGAAVITRAQQLRSYGVHLPAAAFDFRPRPLGAE